ncbi:hypothetical protein CBS133816_6557 [Aspergillus niger]|nr:hypothetical protein CBS133816_6557 [Aspergillus niger]
MPEYSIFWIPCTSYEAVEQAFMSIASLVGLQNMEPAEVKERLQAYFSQTDEKWILVFDNADEMDMWFRGNPPAPPLKNIIPRSENGHVLFTSRNRQLALKLAAANIVSIPDVDQKTGKEILKKLLVQKDLLRDDQMANALLEKLAFLPLAISQAAAYINQNSISLAGYMSLLGEQEASTIEMLSEEFEDDGRYAEIQNPVAMTWLVSFIQIQQGKYQEAEAMHQQALQKREKILGPEHPDTLTSISQLGSVLAQQGKYTEAEIIQQQALQGREKALGPEHPDTLISISQLGSVLAQQGKYTEAEVMYQQDLKVSEKILGPEHPDTLTSISNLGSILAQLGKYTEAETKHWHAFQGYNKTLGSKHPDTLTSFSQLASVLAQQKLITDLP